MKGYWYYPRDLHERLFVGSWHWIGNIFESQHFFFFISENISVLETKHHVCDLSSSETVKCSYQDLTWHGQNIAWYDVSTGVKIKSRGRIELNGLFLKINNIQLDDARTYECRGLSSTRFYTIYVNSEFSLCSCSSSLQHHFRYTSPLI